MTTNTEEETLHPGEDPNKLVIAAVVNTIHKGVHDYTFDEMVASLRTIPVRDGYLLNLVSDSLDDDKVKTSEFLSWWGSNLNYLQLQDAPVKVDMLTLLAGIALISGDIPLAEDAIHMAEQYVDEINELPSLCRLFITCIRGSEAFGKKEDAIGIWRASLQTAKELESKPNK